MTERRVSARRGTRGSAAGHGDGHVAGASSVAGGSSRGERRTALAALLPAGYTRVIDPRVCFRRASADVAAFRYTFACVVDDRLYVAAMRTDRSEDWTPRYFEPGELEGAIARRRAEDPDNRTLAQLEICSREYGCFTAQNTFLMRGEAALPASPKCNARCVGCISSLTPTPAFRRRKRA